MTDKIDKLHTEVTKLSGYIEKVSIQYQDKSNDFSSLMDMYLKISGRTKADVTMELVQKKYAK